MAGAGVDQHRYQPTPGEVAVATQVTPEQFAEARRVLGRQLAARRAALLAPAS